MTTDIHPGTLIGGKYRLDQSIGSGGFSVVFRGVHTAMKRTVAVKIFDARREYEANPERARRRARRFEREARLVSQLQHPNTVTIFDYGVEQNAKLYLVMEFIQGKTLKELLRSQGRLDEERSLSIFLQILSSLEEAHHRGIFHRDLKPANIMLTKNFKGEERVKVLDFGIAQMIGEQQHEISPSGNPIFLGTPRYSAPEQLQAGELTFATDIFGVGALMWLCLLGQPMIPTNNIQRCIALANAPDLWILPADCGLSSELIKIIEKAVHKDPSQRFSDASEMIAAIEAYAATKEDLPNLHSSPFHRPNQEILDPNIRASEEDDHFLLSNAALSPSHGRRSTPPPVKPHRPPHIERRPPPNDDPLLLDETIPLASLPDTHPRPSPRPEPPQGTPVPAPTSNPKRLLLIGIGLLLVTAALAVSARHLLTSTSPANSPSSQLTRAIDDEPNEERPLLRSPFSVDGIQLAIQSRGWRIDDARQPIDLQRFTYHPLVISRDSHTLELTFYDVKDPAAIPEIIAEVRPPNQNITLGHIVVRINPRNSGDYESAYQLREFLSLYRTMVLEEFSD